MFMLIQVPNGLIEGTELFNYFELDELRGRHQNYLVDKELVEGNIGHIPKILEEMILSIQTKEGIHWKGKISEAIYRLPSGDLETILVKIRENTYGPRFYHEARCVNCGHNHKDLRLDLDTLVISPMSFEDMTTPKKVMLPKMAVEVEFKPIYLKDLFEVITIATKKQKTLVTSLLSVTIKRIGDKIGITDEDIDNIKSSDLLFLKDYVQDVKLEGNIDTDIEITCSNCKKDFKIKLNCFDPSFFALTRPY
jgi:hypothetical protein